MGIEGSKQRLYVGCGLTDAPKEFTDEVESLKARLRDDWDVLEFLGTTAGTPEDVYRRDIIENVGGCDAFVGIFDERSTGLGYEAREAIGLRKPVVGVAHKDVKVTRLILGAPAFNPNFRFRRYENMVEDVPTIIVEEFEVIRKGLIRMRSAGADTESMLGDLHDAVTTAKESSQHPDDPA